MDVKSQQNYKWYLRHGMEKLKNLSNVESWIQLSAVCITHFQVSFHNLVSSVHVLWETKLWHAKETTFNIAMLPTETKSNCVEQIYVTIPYFIISDWVNCQCRQNAKTAIRNTLFYVTCWPSYAADDFKRGIQNPSLKKMVLETSITVQCFNKRTNTTTYHKNCRLCQHVTV